MSNRYPKNWFKYDLCIKCPFDNQDISSEVVVFINQLSKIIGNQYIYGFISEYDGMFTILIRAGSKFVTNKAIQESWELPLDADICNVIARKGNPNYYIAPFTINHVPRLTEIPPFQYMYAPYKNDQTINHLYSCPFNGYSPFTKLIRIKMLLDFLQNKSTINSLRENPLFEEERIGNEEEISAEHVRQFWEDEDDMSDQQAASNQINKNDLMAFTIAHLLSRKIITDIFAIHDFSEISELRERLFSVRLQFTQLPYDLLRDYFGELVTFGFAFFDHLLHSLPFIALVGIAFQVLAIYYNNFFSIPELPPFAFFIPFYFIFVIQRWKRNEQIFAMKWNTENQLMAAQIENHSHNNHVRNDFHGKLLFSPVNGEIIIYYSHSIFTRLKLFTGRFLSFAIFVVCIIGTLISISGIYYARYQLRKFSSLATYVQYIASGGNAFISILYNELFAFIGYEITKLENHRSDHNFQSAYTVKMIVYQVVSTLASFYYLAFGAAYVRKYDETTASLGECGYNNCIFPVTINAMVFIFMEVFWRWMSQFWLLYLRVQSSRCAHHQRYRYIKAKERQLTKLQSSIAGSMKPLVKKTSVSQTKKKPNNLMEEQQRDISKDYERTNSMFQEDNPMKADKFKQGLTPPPHSPSDKLSWVDNLKPTIEPDIDLNEDILSPGKDVDRSSVSATVRPKFFERDTDSNSSLRAKTQVLQNRNIHGSSDNDEKEVEYHEEDEELHREGFSSAGDLTPPSSPKVSSYRSPHVQSHRASNIFRFYHDFPANNSLTMNEQAQIDAESEKDQDLYPPTPEDARSNPHQYESEDGHELDESEEEDEYEKFCTKKAPFERYSGVSYQVEQHYLKNQLFVFRLMLIALNFGSAVPAIFAAIIVVLFIDIRWQLWQLIDYFPRNLPTVSSSIGWIWIVTYDLVLLESIVTNACLIILTIQNPTYSNWNFVYLLLLWIGIVFALILLLLFTHFLFSRIPKEVKIQMKRRHFIRQKLIDRVPDSVDSLPIEML